MRVTRTSMLSGIERTMELDISEQQLERYYQGALVQDAFPMLDDDQREFFMTGITAEEWDRAFAEPDDDR